MRSSVVVPRLPSLFALSLALLSACGSANERGEGEGAHAPSPESPAALTTPTPEDPLVSAATASLVETLAAVGVEARAQGAHIDAGEHTLDLALTVDHSEVHDEVHVLALSFALRLDDQPLPASTSHVVGLGPELDAAQRSALTLWSDQYGSLLIFAIAEREFGAQFHGPSSGTRAADNYIRMLIDTEAIYLSPVGLRGAAVEHEVLTGDPWVETIARLAIAHAGPRAPYRGVSVEARIGSEGFEHAECQVDGVASLALCEALAELEWPAAAPAYTYEQFFLLLER